MRSLNRTAVVLTLATAGCLLKFPNADEPGRYACRNDDDCLAGYRCGPTGFCTNQPDVPLGASLFVELLVADPTPIDTFFAAGLEGEPCHSVRTAGACGVGCTWNAAREVCWTDCAARDSTTCETPLDNIIGGSTCSWDGIVCQNNGDLMAACFLRDIATCTNLAECRVNAQGNRCWAKCAAATTEPQCDAMPCEWDSTAGLCTESPLLQAPQFSIAQAAADGSGVRPLAYDGARTQFRFDPNQIFQGKVRLGNGIQVSQAGMAVLPGGEAAAFAHAYLYTHSDSTGPEVRCFGSQALVLWQVGKERGTPESVLSLTEVQANLFPADTEGTIHFVAFPDLVRDPDGVGLRVVNGDFAEIQPVGNMSSCARRDLTGNMYEAMINLMPVITGTYDVGPLAARVPFPLLLSQVSAGQVLQHPLQAAAATYPCHVGIDTECAPLNVTPGTCAAGHCDIAMDVHGYLPKLIDSGRALLWSNVTCSSGYGAACRGNGLNEYDLVLGTLALSQTQFAVEQLQYVAAAPGLQELDAFLTGDLNATSTLYYLGIETLSTTLQSNNGPQTVSYPRYGLYKRRLIRGTNDWTVQPAADQTVGPSIVGSSQVIGGQDIACALNGQSTTRLSEKLHLTNPIGFTLSADRVYLAYAEVEQDLVCNISTSGNSYLTPGEPTRADVYVIDLTQASLFPVPAYASACAATLLTLNLNPRFTPDGAGVLFSSRNQQTGAVPTGAAYRANLADLQATDCRIIPLVNLDQATTALHQVNGDYTAVGMTTDDSRTFIRPPACGAVGADGALLAGLFAVMWRRRRR